MSRGVPTRRFRAPDGKPFVVVWRQGGLVHVERVVAADFGRRRVEPAEQLKALAPCPKALRERVKQAIQVQEDTHNGNH